MSNIEAKKDELIKIATAQQMEAANPYSSVWVQASAGTGKTKVLSDRVLRLLVEKVNPQKILCLTYTKAAAVEMNERIAKKLSAWTICNDLELTKELKELLGNDYNLKNSDDLLDFARTLFANLLDTPGGMKIQTIHSFCQEILKRFPLEAGISPYFEVMDDRNSKEILQKIKINLLKESGDIANNNIITAIKFLTKNITEYSFPEVMTTITENRNKIDNLLQKYDYNISAIKSKLYNNFNLSEDATKKSIQQDFFKFTNRENFMKALHAFENSKNKKTDLKNFNVFKLVGENDFNHKYFDAYYKVFITKTNTKIKTPATKDAVVQYPELLEFMHIEADRLLDANKKVICLKLIESTISVLTIAKEIIQAYNIEKEQNASLDFEDLIVITKKLLENKDVADWVLFKLDGGIEHILIDEAQDTSPSQWAIIQALSSDFFTQKNEQKINRSVFVVGDRKQSIYSFQGADPNEFDNMYKHFKKQCLDFKKIQLDVSFRSTEAIMNCVNKLFASDVVKKGVVAENETVSHSPFRIGEGGFVEISPLIKKESQKIKDNANWVLPITKEQNTSLSNQLAKLIAGNIKQMVENKEILASKNRPIRYGDFMFLVRQRKSFVEEFVRACKEIGVNVSGVDKLELLEQIAVHDLVSLGKFLLNPYDDLSLAESLKSPIFNLDDDNLFELCYKRDTSLFKIILKNDKYSLLASQLKDLLNLSGYMRPFELYNYILTRLNGKKNFFTRMGHEVEDTLDEFMNLTLKFERNNIPNLQNFINWINTDKIIVKREMEQSESDSVRIMTVHGSKGLQAPIVILAETTKVENKSRKKKFLWDNNDLVYFPTCAADYEEKCTNINNKNHLDSEEESKRLLYVALTRAEDRLYISGFEKKKEVSENSWYKLLQDNIKSNIPLNEDDKRIVYDIPQTIAFNDKEEDKNVTIIYNNDFVITPIEPESPLARPYQPSKDINQQNEIVASPLKDNGNFYKRGNAIHTLLQHIFNIKEENRIEICNKYIIKNLPEFSKKEQEKIIDEIINLCTKYNDFFEYKSIAEVPIVGEVDGKIISAKIDRLIIKDDEVIIIDYKTNRPAAMNLEDVPKNYINQLKIYKSLLERIYINKKITTYILWTNTCNLMKI